MSFARRNSKSRARCNGDSMRGKRKLRKVEAMSSESERVYECDLCAWLLRVPADVSFGEVQSEFDGHNCKVNALKRKPLATKKL